MSSGEGGREESGCWSIGGGLGLSDGTGVIEEEVEEEEEEDAAQTWNDACRSDGRAEKDETDDRVDEKGRERPFAPEEKVRVVG